MIVTAKKHKGLAVAVIAGAAILGGGLSLGISGATQRADDAQKQATERAAVIRSSQVAACEASLKPGGVRFIVAQQIKNQLTQSQHLNYHKFFPSIPAGHLHALIQRQRAQQFQEINDLLGVNCAALYPKP